MDRAYSMKVAFYNLLHTSGFPQSIGKWHMVKNKKLNFLVVESALSEGQCGCAE